MPGKRMLQGCRALDLTDENGFLCGKILADLGVDVIKIEKPGGDESREIGPFWHNETDPEKSLYWFAYNSDKRGITLDIEANDGKQVFSDLVKTADFIIESFQPGYMDTFGLGYSGLTGIKENIILISITPFGQSGPYSGYKGSDLVVMGMSGELFLTGDSDRPPVNISMPQACQHAGADAAVGAMIAYYHKKKTGEGQHVDVSMQHSVAWFLSMTIPYWEVMNIVLGRQGACRTISTRGTTQRQVWPCKDGFVFFVMMGGQQGAKSCRPLVKWMNERGMANEFLLNFEWVSFDMATASQELIDKLSQPIAEFFMTQKKKEILEAAISRNISLCPLMSMRDLLEDPHLKERKFWKPIEYPELKTAIPYPRQFARSSENEMTSRFKAPLIGEHNTEIYAEIGLSKERIAELKEAGVI
jgi:benzylsuccinate CoA-transferase BbsE subunit